MDIVHLKCQVTCSDVRTSDLFRILVALQSEEMCQRLLHSVTWRSACDFRMENSVLYSKCR